MKIPVDIPLIVHSNRAPIQRPQSLLEKQGWRVQTCNARAGETLPDPNSIQGAIIMGATMGMYEHDTLPWMQQEMKWLEQVLAKNVPVYGICFGCHMLTQVYGGTVVKGDPGFVFGFTRVQQVADDDVFGQQLDGVEVFQAHQDTYTLPQTAKGLMVGDIYREQAAKFGERVYGTQFHPEITTKFIEDWHQFGWEQQRADGVYLPETVEEHVLLAEQKLPAPQAWFESFLANLFGQPE